MALSIFAVNDFFETEINEVKDAIMYLLSDKASGIHCAFLPIDGGIWQAAATGIWPGALDMLK